jgi:hypothetical protein
MDWFERLTGFREEGHERVTANFEPVGQSMISKVNGRVMNCGRLEMPSLAELRERVGKLPRSGGRLTVRSIVANVKELHIDPSNTGALFQVASQFNLLEMVSPSYTPEHGVGIYENDHTQGPACAIAAGAGTIFRNYFVEVNGRIGQTADNQIDCLADIGELLGNQDGRLWEVKNGYALATADGLEQISNYLKDDDGGPAHSIRQRLRIGVHSDTEVTAGDSGHTVTQAFGSALPVSYSGHSSRAWEPFARVVLEASYEATLCAALINKAETGCKKVFLTLLGGGAFGNENSWIEDAMERAFEIHQDSDLDVAIVSYRNPQPFVQRLVDRFG